jgi:hypothetical protein
LISMSALRRLFFVSVCCGLLAGLAVAQSTSLSLGTSVTDFQLQGGGGASIVLTLAATNSITFTNGLGQNVTCPAAAGEYVLACGSASGGGALFADSDSAGPSYFVMTTPSATPLAFQAYGSGSYNVSQSAPIAFSFSAPEGSLSGAITINGVTVGANGAVALVGTFTATGGSFASVFTTGQGTVQLPLALAANLSTLVNSAGTMTGQIEYPGSLAPVSDVPASCIGDFLTGGGWIPISGGNGKATFAIHGGCKLGHGWGRLNYVDHATGMHVKGTADPSCPIAYSVVSTGPAAEGGNPTGCREMQGAATINGQGGYRYQVIACDNAQPGRGADTFALSLSNGYSQSGTLGGGNIQLHKGNQSFSQCPQHGGGNAGSGSTSASSCGSTN